MGANLKLLVIETSGNTCGFAVSVDGHIQKVSYLGDRSSLSQRIMGLIDETLRAAGCDVHQLNGIAVSLGPGSWTGLRIGVTTAKSLAQALGVPLVGVPTFEAVARALHDSIVPRARLIIYTPCRKGEVYVAVFDEEGRKVDEEHIVTIDNFIARLREEKTPRTVFGFPTDERRTDLRGRAVVFAHRALTGTTAIAHERLTQGKADDLFAVKPIYLAPSQAERVTGIHVT